MGDLSRELRLHQCPGCWSYGTHDLAAAGWYECACGEKLTVVDLRQADAAEGLAEALKRIEYDAGHRDDDLVLNDIGRAARSALASFRTQEAK